jgi:hypothetical protein
MLPNRRHRRGRHPAQCEPRGPCPGWPESARRSVAISRTTSAGAGSCSSTFRRPACPADVQRHGIRPRLLDGRNGCDAQGPAPALPSACSRCFATRAAASVPQLHARDRSCSASSPRRRPSPGRSDSSAVAKDWDPGSLGHEIAVAGKLKEVAVPLDQDALETPLKQMSPRPWRRLTSCV